jgi:hypothetical protein
MSSSLEFLKGVSRVNLKKKTGRRSWVRVKAEI